MKVCLNCQLIISDDDIFGDHESHCTKSKEVKAVELFSDTFDWSNIESTRNLNDVANSFNFENLSMLQQTNSIAIEKEPWRINTIRTKNDKPKCKNPLQNKCAHWFKTFRSRPLLNIHERKHQKIDKASKVDKRDICISNSNSEDDDDHLDLQLRVHKNLTEVTFLLPKLSLNNGIF